MALFESYERRIDHSVGHPHRCQPPPTREVSPPKLNAGLEDYPLKISRIYEITLPLQGEGDFV